MAHIYLPDDFVSEPGATSVALRLMLALQLLAPAGDWTPPLPAPALASRLLANPDTVGRAARWLLARGCIERRYVGRPHGGRQPQYRIRPAPTPAGRRL